jgi:hypothetical protein
MVRLVDGNFHIKYIPNGGDFTSLDNKIPEKFYPCVDGHFWLVRNGKIIDTYFDEYDYIRKVNGCNDKQVYLPASPLVQAVIKQKYAVVNESRNIKQEDWKTFGKEPTPYRCYKNANDSKKLRCSVLGWR